MLVGAQNVAVRSTDFGQTWSAQQSPFSNSVTTSLIAATTEGFIAFGQNGVVAIRSSLPASVVRAQSANRLQIWPMPCNNELNIQLAEGPIDGVRLFDNLGKMVLECSGASPAKTLRISLPSTLSGTYALEVAPPNGMSATQTIVIIHHP
jgi:hypothetical protein